MADQDPIDAEFEVISGPLPSADVIPPRPKPWWDDLFAEQDPVEVDNSWASAEEMTQGVVGCLSIPFGLALVYGAIHLAKALIGGH